MNSDNPNQGEEKGNVNSISSLTIGDESNKECYIVHQSTKRPISDSELLEGQESVHISKRSQLDSSGGSDEPSDDSKSEEATNDASELNFEHEYKQLLKSYQTIMNYNSRKPVKKNSFYEDSIRYLGDTITIFSIHEYFGSDYSMAMRKYFRQHYHDSSFKVRDKSAEWDRVKRDILHI